MARRLFRTHLQESVNSPPVNISQVRLSDDDAICFRFSYCQTGLDKHADLKLMFFGDYPHESSYMVFTEEDSVDARIPPLLELLPSALTGKALHFALTEISKTLTSALSKGSIDDPIELDDEPVAYDSDNFLDNTEEADAFGFEDSNPAQPFYSNKPTVNTKPAAASNMGRALKDLIAIRKAGFRVGIIGDLAHGSILCLSVRMAKLGISEEAFEAWSLNHDHYLLLMIRFQHGYPSLEKLLDQDSANSSIVMRVGVCEKYKPTPADAYAFFDQTPKQSDSTSMPESARARLSTLFIGESLNTFLNRRFHAILKARIRLKLGWYAAENYINDMQGKTFEETTSMETRDCKEPDSTMSTFADVVMADCLQDPTQFEHISYPLAAMQLLLRHFVRCTEFCLNCHTKVSNTFEALKPYVCSKSLCLWQCVTFGFGPNLDWEVLSQPLVVDLLISFCYTAARNGRLKDLPTGISLAVPFLPHFKGQFPPAGLYGISTMIDGNSQTGLPPASAELKDACMTSFTAQMCFDTQRLVLPDKIASSSISPSQSGWIVIRHEDIDCHYRIEANLMPTLHLGQPVLVKKYSNEFYAGYNSKSEKAATSPDIAVPEGTHEVECFPYNQEFDTLNKSEQMWAIATLLDTLPGVIEMKTYIEENQSGRKPDLKEWRDKISDSALTVMRWIIASNRSCIVQVGMPKLQETLVADSNKPSDRVGSMDGYLQFRFAQGAPDKEQRFVDSIKQEAIVGSLPNKFPTLFAWHGSALYNWHSIVREGLRYDTVANGRAYGDGIYLSSHASVSIGYTNKSCNTSGWPQSVLKISNALSLNEVVNVPNKFVHNHTHLVVDKLDWIQTRYLFVQSIVKYDVNTNTFVEYQQDPSRIARDASNQPVRIPLSAIPQSRRPKESTSVVSLTSKKIKVSSHNATINNSSFGVADEMVSEVSDEEDQSFLSVGRGGDTNESDFEDALEVLSIADDEDHISSIPVFKNSQGDKGKKRAHSPDKLETDFVPGTLDVTNIKFLDPPADATIVANQGLMKAFREVVKIQNSKSTSLSKLGWWVDEIHHENNYQWIVELHSFDPDLPLAQDMKKASITSIVVEMLFTSEYPFSPPFIRVVTPRFLPFQQGGGGHVTEGGAICMELLTSNGWSPGNNIESILLQVRLELSEKDPPARLLVVHKQERSGRFQTGGGKKNGYQNADRDSYGIGEAISAYERACGKHGWTVPKGFSKLKAAEQQK